MQETETRNSHNTASGTTTGVTSFERVGVSTFTQVVLTVVDDDGTANDAVRAEERDVLVCRGRLAVFSILCGCEETKKQGRRGKRRANRRPNFQVRNLRPVEQS